MRKLLMQRFERKFQMWEYWVSRSQLLLRSRNASSQPRTIDLVFVSVDYIELPTLMSELEIVEASAEECTKAEHVLGRRVPTEQVFAFKTKDRRYLVVAG